ncbi:phage portal protein [Streptomyces sp. HNM0645]|uniref:phage portal protein n=1 Tax=Streptomyces sp. HNM0645 TaxID=2782343 RepID=UPI0024B776D2|nr:phage portal protein [Streptomyces sp. HNM0645]MDI9885911.1 phage portal protein [Streptomyces sp. HNM0645]
MATLLERIAAARGGPRGGRKEFTQSPFWSLDSLRSSLLSTTMPDRERIENDFEGYVEGAYKRNGPVFACMLARQMVFSEARLTWRQFRGGRPGDLFGTQDLALLEAPWPGGTTGELLVRMIQDADLAGNFYATTADDAGRVGKAATGPGRRVVRMRPDWVTLVLASASGDPYALDTKVVGYLYEPRSVSRTGMGSPSGEAVLLLPDEVAHFSPIPDPVARFRGMSWLTPVLREIQSDNSATSHKDSVFQNAALPSMVVKFARETTPETFDKFVARFKASHQGAENAHKTLFLGGGADVTPLTFDFRQLEFSQTQGKGESRIASAAGVPPSWVGFSEGLQGSALNAGNFSAARRRFADGTVRPLWRQASAALQVLVPPPAGAQLWYDGRDIAFLREDRKDAAEIQRQQASTIRQLTDAGYTPGSVVAAVRAEDWSLLAHTGLYSVQLQRPGVDQFGRPTASGGSPDDSDDAEEGQ